MTATMVRAQLVHEQRMFWRNPMGAFSSAGLPLALLVIIGTMNQGAKVKSLGGVDFNQFYVPGILTFLAAGICYANLGITTAYRRDFGILKHLRSTPLPPGVYIAAAVTSSLIVTALITTITLLVAVAFFGVVVPARYPTFLVTMFVGALTFCALGFVASRVKADSSIAVVNLLMFPLVMGSGVLLPLNADSLVIKVASLFPVRHFGLAMYSVFDPGRSGAGFEPGHLAVVGVWGLAALVVARLTFRWEPRPR